MIYLILSAILALSLTLLLVKRIETRTRLEMIHVPLLLGFTGITWLVPLYVLARLSAI